MRVLVTGSRTLKDPTPVWTVLAGLREIHGKTPFVVIHGHNPRGADHWADTFPGEARIDRYPADWEQFGPAAGPLRNRDMLVRGGPDLVVAFVDKPLYESKGTADMVHVAKEAEVPTWVVTVE
jgi:hypothetical protein